MFVHQYIAGLNLIQYIGIYMDAKCDIFFTTYILAVTPQISLSSQTLMTEEKQNITIACTATGQPQPIITWSKSVGSLPKGRNEVINGALTIYNVTKKDRGIYICKAENILGSASDTAHLMVFSPLRFKDLPPRTVTPFIGSTLRFRCVAECFLRPSITWTKDGMSSVSVSSNVLTNIKKSTKDLTLVGPPMLLQK